MKFKCTLKHFHDVLPGYFGVTLKIALELNPELIVYPQITGNAITLCFTEEENSHIACVSSPSGYKRVSVVTVTKVLPPGFDINTLGEKIDDI
jgi:hypothetical protein